ncbi:hypothetical protein [Streptosporangium sp. KLBMP 9127]|nr:hypothetical protein [Streptosporangium sp. KLBMP 9127]
MARRTRMALAGLSLAGLGLLTPMGSATAATTPPSPDQVKSVTSTERSALAAPACWTTVSQPGGNGTTITVQYRNCASTPATVTVISYAVAFDGTYTYTGRCQTVPGGGSFYGEWVTSPSRFPPVDTTGWGVTNCI